MRRDGPPPAPMPAKLSQGAIPRRSRISTRRRGPPGPAGSCRRRCSGPVAGATQAASPGAGGPALDLPPGLVGYAGSLPMPGLSGSPSAAIRIRPAFSARVSLHGRMGPIVAPSSRLRQGASRQVAARHLRSRGSSPSFHQGEQSSLETRSGAQGRVALPSAGRQVCAGHPVEPAGHLTERRVLSARGQEALRIRSPLGSSARTGRETPRSLAHRAHRSAPGALGCDGEPGRRPSRAPRARKRYTMVAEAPARGVAELCANSSPGGAARAKTRVRLRREKRTQLRPGLATAVNLAARTKSRDRNDMVKARL